MNKTRSGKRGATSDLNHENWDAEEEEEERGIFATAPKEVISKRKIKVAKRRGVCSEDTGTGGLFKSFTAFGPSTGTSSDTSGSNSTNVATLPAFAFGAHNSGSSNTSKPFAFSAGGSSEKAGERSTAPQKMQFGVTPFGFTPKAMQFNFNASAATKPVQSLAQVGDEKSKKKEEVSVRDQHLHCLRDLNLSVNKWITSHVEKDPYCDLTPVFADYEKHLREIERKYPYEEEKEEEEGKPASKTRVLGCSNGDGGSSFSRPPVVLPNFGLSAAAMEAVAEEDGEDEEEKTTEKEEEEEEEKEAKKEDKTEGESKSDSKSFMSLFSITKTTEASDQKNDEKKKDESLGEKKSALEPFPKFACNFDGPSGTLSLGKSETKTTIPSFSFSKTTETSNQKNDEKKEDESLGEKKKSAFEPLPKFVFNNPQGPVGTPAFMITSVPSLWSGPSLGSGSSLTGAPKQGEEEDEYVPPKVEVRDIKEEGSVLSKRCKLYYKLEDSWHDKGVGNLHLKPLDEGKIQFLIRADTNLGNILLNIMLTNQVPITRNKTNLTLICIPTPPMRPPSKSDDGTAKPMPLLVRLKTESDAEQVLAEIERLVKKE